METTETARGGAARQFLNAYRRESAITRKLLRAYPAEQSELRPHERSNSARQLAWTFVVEQVLMLRALGGGPVLTGGGFPPPPDSWEEIVDRFEHDGEAVEHALEEASDATMHGVVQFFVGPKEVGDYATADFLWFLLHDQIHHRGQLSVYLRMAGGRVPSIYGPSADEPWT